LLASRQVVVVVGSGGDGAPADDAEVFVGVIPTIYHHLTYANRYEIFISGGDKSAEQKITNVPYFIHTVTAVLWL